MGLNNTQKVVLAIVVFIILLIGWGLFPLFFKWVMIGIGSTKVNIEDFGTMGDIYGSLNTLFTSATLLIVMYSAYLQRQANEDARTAMADQLQQARDDTETQLTQARDALEQQLAQARDALEQQLAQARQATEQQIENAKELSRIELLQTREATQQQLDLAQATHDAQIKESKYAIFSNMFYALLNQKHERFNMIEVRKDGKHLNVIQILSIINDELFKLITEKWKDISKLERDEVYSEYKDVITKICMENDGKKGDNLSNLALYLVSYGNLFELINRNQLSKEDEHFFKCIVRDSMTIGEQVAMFWLAVFNYDIRLILEKNQVLNTFFDERMMPFAVKFLSKDCFSSELVTEKWDEYEREQNPA